MTRHIVAADHIITGFDEGGAAQIVADGAILIDGDQIVEIGPAGALRRAHPGLPETGGKGRVAIPGLINAHHHVGLTPFQMGARDQPLELWFPERLAMRDVAPRLDTLYAAFEMIASGVTTVQHLHSRAPGDTDAVLARADTIIGAYKDLGMRASYSFALRDQNRMIYAADEEFIASLPAALQKPTADYLAGFGLPLSDQIAVFHALRARWQDDALVGIQIAPSNLHWLSDAALESAAQMAEETGAPMHMHLLETPYQKEYARRRTGGSALEHIDSFGLVGPQLTIGHGVWMTPDDVALLAERGGCLCHNCSSNLRLKSGTADLNGFLASGVPVALGLDEAGINDDRDMLQEMRLALTLHRPAGHDAPHPTASQILRMATEHGAATTPFAGRIGRLAPGRLADIVLLDWQAVTKPWQDPTMPLVDVLIRRAKSGAVATVLIGGNVVYDEGRFTNIDREQVLEEIASDLARPCSESEVSMQRLSRDLIEPVSRFYEGWLGQGAGR
ncbi:amidohydrolase family protein [Roseobacter sp. HKCCD9010]|uniref:amidohydrolase family protein n=2 Tax=unclassified Roseobacter TaxID=196798 RepID=UPI0014930AD3|nr:MULTISPECIES: amidohydrolase family protein [unclassified Roseobacter]MBF9050420.1 amidohydrolase family protein [Rhodobacterales bacterium HKCCD4356]NNV12163.1 amidohydrolase family protein [Roseobacter sp. HKCCD7357]NNV17177.1 amidohydrolase family protein [Roseobacter sp. HKCCD8768]NNV26406.1 amidohydrolase family protein [Roseobacter sp. HKCCD8192]NNV30901.1 amidohydrolase family protein [Roseobacter sp. HKCCD9061]